MNHFTSPSFWESYKGIPGLIQDLADKNFAFLKNDTQHPSLHFKKVGRYWSVRVGMKHRALAVEMKEGLLWFWIGAHAEYDKLVK